MVFIVRERVLVLGFGYVVVGWIWRVLFYLVGFFLVGLGSFVLVLRVLGFRRRGFVVYK